MSHNKISLIKSIQILSSFVVARFLKRYHPKISKMKDLDKLILISHAQSIHVGACGLIFDDLLCHTLMVANRPILPNVPPSDIRA